MAIEIRVPRLGWSMEEGHFSQWLKPDGAEVGIGDMLYELESDKATQEIESLDTGILRRLPQGPGPGERVKVGQLLGYLCAVGEEVPLDEPPLHGTNIPAPLGGEPAPAEPAHPTAGQSGPSVRRLARELHVDLDQLTGTGGRGRITREDVLRAREVQAVPQTPTPLADLAPTASPPMGGIRREPALRRRVSPRAARLAAEWGINLRDVEPTGASGRIREQDVRRTSGSRTRTPEPARPDQLVTPSQAVATSSIRHTIARRMVQASQESAAVTLHTTADATELVQLRNQWQRQDQAESPRLPGYTDICVKLAAEAIRRHPEFLRQWHQEGIRELQEINISVAIHTEYGLVTPVVRDVPHLSLGEVTARISDLIIRARNRQLSREEMEGGAFTITNLGAFRVDAFTPILNLPQAGIWGLGRICEGPQAVAGQVIVRPQMALSLTFDHRVMDGVPAAHMLTTLCAGVEKPSEFGLSR